MIIIEILQQQRNPRPFSIYPILMADRQPIQSVYIELPFRHKTIYQVPEAVVVGRFQQVGHLMYNDVLQALRRFFGKLGIEPDIAGNRVAATPLGLHSLHKKPVYFHTQQRLPLGDQGWHGVS